MFWRTAGAASTLSGGGPLGAPPPQAPSASVAASATNGVARSAAEGR